MAEFKRRKSEEGKYVHVYKLTSTREFKVEIRGKGDSAEEAERDAVEHAQCIVEQLEKFINE
jgi:hypothetical protein